MGVFHLMGLGMSPGVVTAPLSYLARRYTRWNNEDQQFFAYSGEAEQRKEGEKTGDVQGIVIFSTREVISGKSSSGKPFNCFDYQNNQPGKPSGKDFEGDRMLTVIEKTLKQKACNPIFGGRTKVPVFWCCIDRYDVAETYEHIIQTIAALSSVGRQGKEIWINLTGGSNPMNFALQLATTLSESGARQYYVQAQGTDAHKCIHFTSEENYWLELPILPLDFSTLNQQVLALLEEGDKNLEQIYQKLFNTPAVLEAMRLHKPETFRDDVLAPMWKRTLIIGNEDSYSIGPQWDTIRPYAEKWLKAKKTSKDDGISIEELAKRESWIDCRIIKLS